MKQRRERNLHRCGQNAGTERRVSKEQAIEAYGSFGPSMPNTISRILGKRTGTPSIAAQGYDRRGSFKRMRGSTRFQIYRQADIKPDVKPHVVETESDLSNHTNQGLDLSNKYTFVVITGVFTTLRLSDPSVPNFGASTI